MKRILVSNTSISDQKIGSWTQRITLFYQKNPDFIDFFLCPNLPSESKFIYCSKKKRVPFLSKWFTYFESPYYRSSEFIRAFEKLGIPDQQAQVIVMDDIILLAGFAALKMQGKKFQLIYSFHGHAFKTTGDWIHEVDKVLFLTQLGYKKTKNIHQEFTPEVSIVGNGVDSKRYFPLNPSAKKDIRSKLGYSSEDILITWLSNDRPKKGLKLFLKLIPFILAKFPQVKFQIIGNLSAKVDFGTHVKFLGKLPNQELPTYLQASDVYCFTSLWDEGFGLSLVEAAKCGNVIVASTNGGIPEVLENHPASFFVESPNILEEWLSNISAAIRYVGNYTPDEQFLREFHPVENWEEKFKKALQ